MQRHGIVSPIVEFGRSVELLEGIIREYVEGHPNAGCEEVQAFLKTKQPKIFVTRAKVKQVKAEIRPTELLAVGQLLHRDGHAVLEAVQKSTPPVQKTTLPVQTTSPKVNTCSETTASFRIIVNLEITTRPETTHSTITFRLQTTHNTNTLRLQTSRPVRQNVQVPKKKNHNINKQTKVNFAKLN